jgi:hypothetical protein
MISGNYYETLPNERREVEEGLNNEHQEHAGL